VLFSYVYINIYIPKWVGWNGQPNLIHFTQIQRQNSAGFKNGGNNGSNGESLSLIVCHFCFSQLRIGTRYGPLAVSPLAMVVLVSSLLLLA
jgi:hypothetical protein